MFTGLVEAVGCVLEQTDRPVGDGQDQIVRRLRIQTPWQGAQAPELGDSVAIDGVCLTVTERQSDTGVLAFEVAEESRKRTTLGRLRLQQPVHLERALCFGARLGGHLLSGHVDGVGEVVRSEQQGGSWMLEVRAPEAVMRLSMPQGAIALAGVSLTLNEITQDTLIVGLVPHTLEKTRLSQLQPGDSINCEADLLARYVARLVTRARPGLLDDPQSAP